MWRFFPILLLLGCRGYVPVAVHAMATVSALPETRECLSGLCLPSNETESVEGVPLGVCTTLTRQENLKDADGILDYAETSQYSNPFHDYPVVDPALQKVRVDSIQERIEHLDVQFEDLQGRLKRDPRYKHRLRNL